ANFLENLKSKYYSQAVSGLPPKNISYCLNTAPSPPHECCTLQYYPHFNIASQNKDYENSIRNFLMSGLLKCGYFVG
ncbi:hypothetical protein L9F63_016800, partial [Diploptera punctata]